MDIVSHALWTAAAASSARAMWRASCPPVAGKIAGAARRIACATPRPPSPLWAVLWGVFPDAVSFTVPAVVRTWWFLTGQTTSLLPQPGSRQFQFVWQLYDGSHSAVVFAVVFGMVWLAARRPALAMLGWALHIAVDVPTHRGMFAVHFLWPLSRFGVNGVPWESRWLLAANFAALAGVYGWMWRWRKRGRSPQAEQRGA